MIDYKLNYKWGVKIRNDCYVNKIGLFYLFINNVNNK